MRGIRTAKLSAAFLISGERSRKMFDSKAV